VNNQNPKQVILAHDSFTQFGGAERVANAFHQVYPDSPMYTLAVDPKISQSYPDINFKTSLIQYLYNFVPKLQLWFAAVPVAIRFLKIEPAKVVLSSSSAYMKGLRKPKGSIHINYCHTPTRFLWNDYIYAENEIIKPLRWLARLYFAWLRRWDLKAANAVDHFIANSKEVQTRIKTFYNRESIVIYPFVDTNYWKPSSPKQDYYLIAGRVTPYKGYDTIVKIFNELGLPLHLVGDGRYLSYLKSIAKSNITFYGKVTDEELRNQYSAAKAFIYPQIEDFGLMPLEASSCGTPTIALAKAGSLETVDHGVSGFLIDEFNTKTFSEALEKMKELNFTTEAMQAHAQKFSKQRFLYEIKAYVDNHSV
jgi:glycosyltransferase involved in cell wall biosynthesis